MIGSGINWVMTVIGFSVSTTFIVFICTRLICARIQLNLSRRSFPITSRSDLSILERGLHGLEPVVVANFPLKKYGDELFLASEDAQCPVCLTEYRHEDIVRILPYCGHFFHMTCIDIWLLQHSTCPVCRISLRECPDKKRMMQPLFSSAIRSPYAMQSFDTHACNCLLAGHGRTHDSRAMGSVRESFCAPEDPEAARGENIYPRTEGNQTGTASLENKGKITDANPFQCTQVWSASYTGSPLTESNQIVNDSGNKHVESTSNI